MITPKQPKSRTREDFEERAYRLADRLGNLAAAGAVFVHGVNQALLDTLKALDESVGEKGIADDINDGAPLP